MAAVTVYSAPDDGRKVRPKHVEFQHQINRMKKAASRWYLYDKHQEVTAYNVVCKMVAVYVNMHANQHL